MYEDNFSFLKASPVVRLKCDWCLVLNLCLIKYFLANMSTWVQVTSMKDVGLSIGIYHVGPTCVCPYLKPILADRKSVV